MKRYALILIPLLIVLAACVGNPVQPQSLPVGQPVPASCFGGGSDANANATVAARCQQDTAATVMAINQQTAVAQQAAESERIAATAQAAVIASETAVAATSTSENLVVRQTEQAMAFEAGNATATAAYEQTRASSASTREAAVATAEAEALQLQYLATRRELERQENVAAFWNVAYYVMLVVLVALVVGTAVYAAVWYWKNRQPIQTVTDGQGNTQIVILSPDGRIHALAPRQAILPEPDVAGLLEAPRIGTPNWSAFVAHRDRFMVPIGVDVSTGEPILIDRREDPHLLIAGTTGSGKSASGALPFILAMWGANAHILVLNGKGADYTAVDGEINFTLLSTYDVIQAIEPLSRILSAIEMEYNRRNQVLRQWNAANWNELPERAGESGEIVIVLEEFLTLIEKADELKKTYQINKEAEQARHMELLIFQLWNRLSSIVSQARKAGITLVVVLTDATDKAIGTSGAKVKKQSTRLVFRMKSGASSRSLLDIEKGSDYPSGTVGFRTGQFLINVDGRVRHGAGFYAQDDNVDQYLISRQVRPSPLPDLVLKAIQTESGVWTTQQPHPRIVGPGQAQRVQIGAPASNMPGPVTQAQQDAQQLNPIIEQVTSLNDIARHFSGIRFDERSYRPDGNLITTRVRPALVWRVRHMRCDKSRALLS